MVYIVLGAASYATARNLESIILSADAYTLPDGKTVATVMTPGALPPSEAGAYLRLDAASFADVALPMSAGGVLMAANFSLLYVSAAVLSLALGALNVASGGMASVTAEYGSAAVRVAVAKHIGRDAELPKASDLAGLVKDRLTRPSGPLVHFARLAFNSYRPWYGFLANLMVAYAVTFMASASTLYLLHRPRNFDPTTHFRVRGSTLYARRTLALSMARALPWTALALTMCVTSGGTCAPCQQISQRILGAWSPL
jgi:hypothetical protein